MRLLTDTQFDRLDKLADERDDAKVVGWHKDGPVIVANGVYKRVTSEGRLILLKGRT